jgi:hypothetical protein
MSDKRIADISAAVKREIEAGATLATADGLVDVDGLARVIAAALVSTPKAIVAAVAYEEGLAEGIRQGRVKELLAMAEWHDGQVRKWRNKKMRRDASAAACISKMDEHKASACHCRAEAAKLAGAQAAEKEE